MTGLDLTSGIPAVGLAPLIGLLLQFLFAMLRIGAFLIASPLFGSRFVPLPIRIVFSVALAVAVMSVAQVPPVEELTNSIAVAIALTEIAIGLSAGLVLTILFGAAALAGDRIASTAGLGFAAQMDPNAGGQTPVVSQIFTLFLLAIFLSLDGHLLVLRLVIDSYATLPIGGAIQSGAMLTAGLEAATQMFTFGMILMLPVVTVLLIVNVVIGVITRSAPQMNIFSFGFPLTMMTAIALLYLGAPALADGFETLTTAMVDAVATLLKGLANG